MRFLARLFPGVLAIAVFGILRALVRSDFGDRLIAAGVSEEYLYSILPIGTMATFIAAYWLNPFYARGRRFWRRFKK